MKNISEKIREKVRKAWNREGVTESELADRFGLTPELVAEIVGGPVEARCMPIRQEVLSLAREIASSLPTELVGPFAKRFEQISGVRAGVLNSR